MKYLFFAYIFVNQVYSFAQTFSDSHFLHSYGFESVLKENGNTIFWFETPVDSVVIDDHITLAKKHDGSDESSTFWILMNSSNQIVHSYEFYSKDERVSVNKYISRLTDGYLVSFYYISDSLWVNDSLYFSDQNQSANHCVAKFSDSGQLTSIWRYQSTGHLEVSKTIQDKNGYFYIFGHTFTDTLIVGNIQLIATNNYIENSDFFIIKLDASGNVLNAKRFGSDLIDICHDAILAEDDYFYVTGFYYGSPFLIDSFKLLNKGFTQITCDALLLKIDSNLNAVWAKSANSPIHEYGQRLALSNDGCIYWGVEYFSNYVTFQDTSLYGQSQNVFVAKLDSNGTIQWIKNVTSSGELRIRGFTSTINHKLWLSVGFTETIHVDSLEVESNGDSDNAILQLNVDGNYLRNFHFGGPEYDLILSIDPIDENILFLEGSFKGDTLEVGNMILPRSIFAEGKTYFYSILNFSINFIDQNQYWANKINFYPNPASSVIFFDLKEKTREGLTIGVYNTLGQNTRTVKFDEQTLKYSFYVDDIPNGLYRLVLWDSRGRFIGLGSVIIQK